MAHFAHYIRRVITATADHSDDALPYAENQPPDQGFERPSHHSAPRYSGAAGRIRTGDNIWLFSQLTTPWGKLPPALDARIDVDDITGTGTGRAARIRFSARDSSRWFPIFDASRLLAALMTRDAAGTPGPLLSTEAPSAGQALRLLREIANPEALIAHSQTLQSLPLDFISYRMRDATPAAFALALQQVQGGHPVFWDRWSLPRRLSERGEALSPPALDTHIRKMITHSRRVWGVQSPGYGAPGSYSLLEKQLAESLGKFLPYP